MRTFAAFVLVLLAAAAFGAYNAFFIVNQTQQAMVLQFGKPERVISEPGLNWKIPFVQTVEFFDKRILDLNTNPLEVIASDQKRLKVDAFARYVITDPLLFYQTVRDQTVARSRLGNVVEGSLRRVLGTATFSDLVRDKREALMQRIAEQVNGEANALGVRVVDVRIKRADLPDANSEAIFNRMKTERAREAAEIRAQGSEAAQGIRANADRQVTVLRASANQQAETLRGQGDGERNRIYAEAFGRDPQFFAFYRSMQAYEEALKSGDTRLVLSPDSEFFRFFNGSGLAGASAVGATPTPARTPPGGRADAPQSSPTGAVLPQ